MAALVTTEKEDWTTMAYVTTTLACLGVDSHKLHLLFDIPNHNVAIFERPFASFGSKLLLHD